MDEADLRKKTETNVFAEFLSKVMPTGQASKVDPPLPSPPPTLQKICRGTQTMVTSPPFTATPPPPNKDFTYEPGKQERVEEDDDDADDYDEDDFVEDEAREYGRNNVGPVASPYLFALRVQETFSRHAIRCP